MDERIKIKGKKTIFRIIFGRTTVIALLFLVEIAIIVLGFTKLADTIYYLYPSSVLIGITLVIYIINRKEPSAFKLAWIIPILLFPIVGALFYFFIRLQFGTKILYKRHRDILNETKLYLIQNDDIIKELERDKENKEIAGLAKYMNVYGGYPIYTNTSVKYSSLGEDKWTKLKNQLDKAEKFIFLEYFIIDKGEMWYSLLDILKRKAKEGIEVKLLYDGTCSIVLLPPNYPKKLAEFGIECKIFQPILPALSTEQNNRDHRKMVVIDGHTAFTGGINIADEYINQKQLYGHWKDTAIMLKGDAAKSFTIMFLQIWNITEKEPCDYNHYINPPIIPEIKYADGFVMPYGDSPLDNEYVGENVYMDILNTATKYVHIMTPYLIPSNEMINALTYSAKRGVDTSIIMPHIPDKWYAYILARTYYKELIENGVKIYEYTPGFVHAKVFVSDDIKAVVGTINLDYRSLFLHFECGCYIYKNQEVQAIEIDYQNTLKKCELITLENCRKFSPIKKLIGSILRLIAPLM